MAEAQVLNAERKPILLTTFYPDADPDREAEFIECLRRNRQSFASAHILLEDGPRPYVEAAPMHLVDFHRRATFTDLFAYANDHLAGRRVAIANADIYFDGGLDRLESVDLADTLLCLSRWDIHADGSASLLDRSDSQDAWIFDAPIRGFPADFFLGVPACDNRLAWEAANAGLELRNPSRSLRAYHLHLSQVHRYTHRDRLDGPVRPVPPDFLGPPRAMPVASAVFAEEMGYAVGKLVAGAPSHVNLDRSFVEIPDDLAALRYTQVVADAVAPVSVELRSAGKLYVLVGDDWWGYEVARAWLAEHGFSERHPRLTTTDGAGFEVWSVVGGRAARFVVPTQVMLVGKRLERREHL